MNTRTAPASMDTAAPTRVPRSMELYRRALELIPGGTQLVSRRPNRVAYGVSPIYAVRAKGARFWDVDGHEYIDWISGIGARIRRIRLAAADLARAHHSHARMRRARIVARRNGGTSGVLHRSAHRPNRCLMAVCACAPPDQRAMVVRDPQAAFSARCSASSVPWVSLPP